MTRSWHACLCFWFWWLLAVPPEALATNGGRRPARLEIQVEGKPSFSRRDLAQLLHMRLPLVPESAGTVRATLRAHGDTVTIEVGGRVREAKLPPDDPLGGARLVALLLLDLVFDEVGGESAPEAPAPAVVTARPRGPEPIFVFGIAPLLSIGARNWTVGVEPVLDARVRLVRWLAASMQVGYSWIATTEQGAAGDSMGQMIIRLGVAPRWRIFDMPMGLVIRPWWMDRAGFDSDGDAGALVGFSAAIRATVRLGDRFFLSGIVGLDLFGRREIFYGLSDRLATNWVVPWFGMGLGLGK